MELKIILDMPCTGITQKQFATSAGKKRILAIMCLGEDGEGKMENTPSLGVNST